MFFLQKEKKEKGKKGKKGKERNLYEVLDPCGDY
jgi:hypothetical protein